MSLHSHTVQALKDALGDKVSTGTSVRDLHARDEAHHPPARPEAVVFPESTDDVVNIVRLCAADQCPLIPFGVGTSLEGHVIPVHGGITVDTSRMNAVLSVHNEDMDAVVQPGVTRKQLNEELKTTGLMFTVDPGANATLGGMAATRASGTNAVRYGTMRENVLALEVVLADGRVIKTGTRARKSSAGYDLTRLFVGSEGTLGVITELTVKLFGQPETVASATCRFDSVKGAVDTVILAIQLGIPMARIELIDSLSIRALNQYNEGMNLTEAPHLFLEFHGTDQEVRDQVQRFNDIASDGGGHEFKWATLQEDRTALWQARHDAYFATKALRPGCDAVVTDSCVPISELSNCIEQTQEAIDRSGLLAPLLGHVGDGNFHLAILINPSDPVELKRAKALASEISELSIQLGGTITGEHGVGLGKKPYMLKEHGDAYHLMGDIKRAFDPLNLMNPGKVVSIN